jgi:hypothetical protein
MRSHILSAIGISSFVTCLVFMVRCAREDFIKESTQYNEKLARCVSDGHKDYECEAMFRDCPSSVRVVPIPLKTGR